MYDRLPDTLFRTKRGLCPCCGAPLPLGEDTSNILCGFCGAKAVLERRLRKTEPEVEGAPLRQFDQHDHAGWERTSRLSEQYAARATCPGCGLGIDEPEHGTRYICGGCGTEAHMERRLVPPPRNPVRGIPRPRHPREIYVYDLQADEEPATEHLVYRLFNEPDEDRATALAAWFEHWAHINATTARLMPAILERMHRAAEQGHRPMVFELSSAIDKCLCSDSGKARETVAALEPWIVRERAERQLISSLGLGTALGLKLLLDSSMLAYKAGDLGQSVACCFAINWMLQRNYDEHPIISQILMHRMFYLSGPPLAFCVMFMHGQVSDVAFRYDPKTTLAYLDDAVAERPCLVPSLDHERGFWCGPAATEEEWRERKAFVDGLRTDEARVAAWRWYLLPPPGASAAFYEEYGRLALALMDDQRPAFRAVGQKRVERIIREIKPCPESIMSLVAARGESLPGEIRRAFLGEYDKCGLSYAKLPNWQSEPKPEEHPEIVEARRLYREGLDMHLEGKQNDRELWKAYWEARGGRPASPPAIFDGVSNGPAPDESRRGRDKLRYPRPWEDGGDAALDPAPERDRPAPGDETAPPDDDAIPHAKDEDDGEEAPTGDDSRYQSPNHGQSVTIWEFVASLPEDQRAQYDEVLRQMEPHRAMIEAAVAQQRGQAPLPPPSGPRPAQGSYSDDPDIMDNGTDRPWRRASARAEPMTPEAPSAPEPLAGSEPTGLLGRLFGKNRKPRADR